MTKKVVGALNTVTNTTFKAFKKVFWAVVITSVVTSILITSIVVLAFEIIK